MMKRLISILAVLMLLVSMTVVLPVTAMADQKMQVTASWLRLRSGPGTNYNIVNKYRRGSLVTILTTRTSRNWYYVRTSRGQTGWMYKSYLSAIGDTTPDAKKSASGIAVASRNVNFRRGPGKNYDVIKLLPAGQTMDITGKTGNWYKVIVGKQTGYVLKTHIKIQK